MGRMEERQVVGGQDERHSDFLIQLSRNKVGVIEMKIT